jgi:transcriptional regulator with XRE-family HTH domain
MKREQFSQDELQIGKKINEIRKNLGLTLEEFGKKITPPVSKSTVSSWINSRNIPQIDSLHQIAQLGNISYNSLVHHSSDEIIFSSPSVSANTYTQAIKALSDKNLNILSSHSNDIALQSIWSNLLERSIGLRKSHNINPDIYAFLDVIINLYENELTATNVDDSIARLFNVFRKICDKIDHEKLIQELDLVD